jgi:hypothetical protein
MTWAKVQAPLVDHSIAGTDLDGILTIAIGVVILILALAMMFGPGRHSLLALVAVLIAMIGVVICAIEIATLKDAAHRYENVTSGAVTVGPGLWIAVVGAAIAVFGGLVKRQEP